MRNFKIGISLLGLGIYALQLFPNLIWMWWPPANNVLTQNNSPYAILNGIEGVFGILTVALLILVVPKGNHRSLLYLGLAGLCILGYYAAWILYYQGNVAVWLLIGGIAAMPPLYFLFAALWLGNDIVLLPCVIFGAAHVLITCSTYLGR